MALIKNNYPVNSSQVITCVLTSLATDPNLLAGRASTAVDNTVNLDLDHLLSGVITTGTTPTAGTTIEVWVYSYHIITTGTPTYPDSITGTDANKSMTSANVKSAALIRAYTIVVDATTARSYYFPPLSIASLFGGTLPPYWGVFVVHNTAVALNATAGNHVIHYERIQAQTV